MQSSVKSIRRCLVPKKVNRSEHAENTKIGFRPRLCTFFTSLLLTSKTYALVHEKLKHLSIALQIITQIFYSSACSFRHNYL